MTSAALIGKVLAAIMAVESHGNPLAIGDHGNARGLYQMHEAAWHETLDRNTQLSLVAWKDGAHDPKVSRAVAAAYLNYWGNVYELRTGKEATAEVLARIWNGGPRGYEKRSTLKYWKRVQAKLQ